MSIEELRKEAETFFEWPTDAKDHVTLTSALIFAKLMVDKERESLKRPAPCERFCESVAFNAEIKRLRGAIRRYCQLNEDMPDEFRAIPQINELFYIDMQYRQVQPVAGSK